MHNTAAALNMAAADKLATVAGLEAEGLPASVGLPEAANKAAVN
ncbi:MAG: hypothetical protein PHT06_04235 [Dehalococcoidales bacterium]|nr:hypothetical protein [Dehalococcoidales bacterium]